MKNIAEILSQLERGELRAASKDKGGQWKANVEVKSAILEAFRQGKLVEWQGFVDKNTLLPQDFTPEDRVRLVPQGSTIRRGSFVAPGVIVMPPSYINVGAFVDEETMVDSHVLVGSCSQIGKRVHLSAGVKIGGVLEPVGETPVIVEDDVFIGASSAVVEGIKIGEGAVIAPGVILSKGIRVFDCVNERQIDIASCGIPSLAVVVGGSRPLGFTEGISEVRDKHQWASKMGLSVNCALIVKYRDPKTSASLLLEDKLR